MICVSLSGVSVEALREVLAREELVELRLDLLDVAKELPDLIKNAKAQVIVTYRPKPSETEADQSVRRNLLISAIEAGAAMVDVEIEADTRHFGKLLRASRGAGKKLIFSYHQYDKTPPVSALEKIVQQGFEAGADIVKIATQIKSREDNAKLLSLLSDPRPLVVVGMGPLGTVTRVVAPLLGSKFTYASLDERNKTAAGQLTCDQMREIFETLGKCGLTQ